MLNRTSGVVFAFCGDVSRMRFLGCTKRPKTLVFSINPKLSNPSFSVGSPMNAKKAGAVIFSGLPFVLHVDFYGSLSKVINAISSVFSANMVKITNGPAAINIEPRKSMLGVIAAINVDVAIPVSVGGSSNVSDVIAALIRCATDEMAAYRVVVQEFFKALLGNHGCSVSKLNCITI